MDSQSRLQHDLLERILLDENEEPANLPLWYLESITNNFADDRKIGSGGFADVYKGLFRKHIVAVKKLKQVHLEDPKFIQEVGSLMRVKHKNIVRLLGYCSNTEGKMRMHEGRYIQVENVQRFLCFEFLPEGSLDKYMNDASRGHEWRISYQIIRGICEGLYYLHQQKIVHSDLKPQNILLDHGKVPKIADFGLARCFGEEQSRAITSTVAGTLGYMAPEFFEGVITFKSDIYSFGTIITEILTGKKKVLNIDNVCESWSARLQKSQEDALLEHVRVCAEIGLQCMDHDPLKRPDIVHIISKLDKLERQHGFIGTGLWATQMMGVHPLEVCFHFEPYQRIERLVTLINRTDHHVIVRITPTHPDMWKKCHHDVEDDEEEEKEDDDDVVASVGFPYTWKESHDSDGGSTLLCGLGPRSSRYVYMTMTEQEQPPIEAEMGMFEVVMVATESKEALSSLEDHYEDDVGTEMYRETLSAVVTYDAAECQHDEVAIVTPQFIPLEETSKFGDIKSIDMHPIKPWVLVGHNEGYISIWNYETKENDMKAVDVLLLPNNKDRWRRTIESAIFIAGQEWFAAGDRQGSVYVYSYHKRKVKEFEPHGRKPVDSLAVHPTKPLFLTSSSQDESIKLWDWAQGWTCTRVFEYHSRVDHLEFGPKDTNNFASYSRLHSNVKLWHLGSSNPIETMVESNKPTFCTDRLWNFMVTCDISDYEVKIWDLQTMKQIHSLHETRKSINQVACHPTLPILAIVTASFNTYAPSFKSNKRHLYLWDTRTYRLNKRVEFSMAGWIVRMAFDRTEGSTRLVLVSSEKICIIEISLPGPLARGGN